MTNNINEFSKIYDRLNSHINTIGTDKIADVPAPMVDDEIEIPHPSPSFRFSGFNWMYGLDKKFFSIPVYVILPIVVGLILYFIRPRFVLVEDHMHPGMYVVEIQKLLKYTVAISLASVVAFVGYRYIRYRYY